MSLLLGETFTLLAFFWVKKLPDITTLQPPFGAYVFVILIVQFRHLLASFLLGTPEECGKADGADHPAHCRAILPFLLFRQRIVLALRQLNQLTDMLSFCVSYVVAVSINLDIAANVATLLHHGNGYNVNVRMRFGFVEMNLKADDILLAIHLAREVITVNSPLLNGLLPSDTPVMPGRWVALVINLLTTESQLLHQFSTARQDKLDVCILLIRRSSLVLLEVNIFQYILVTVI